MYICFGMVGIGVFLFLIQHFFSDKKRKLSPKKENPKIAILIAARDESAVISSLFDSIDEQSVSIASEDVYVIIENREDPTYFMARNRGISVLFRKSDLQRKGYALKEGIEQILERGKQYDLYFILDADNVMDSHFIEEMLPFYKRGYAIATGCRCPKNPNDSCIALASSFTFLFLNSFINQYRMKKNRNVILSGTGFFIRGDLIESWQGYPFHTLTEDYELSLYSFFHHIPSAYSKKALYYDEQPISFRVSMIQRTRWVKGFLESRKLYIPSMRKAFFEKDFSLLPDLIGITPIFFILIGIFLAFGNLLFHMFAYFSHQVFFAIFLLLFLIYFFLLLITLVLCVSERKYIHTSFSKKCKAIFFHPIFLASYLICFFQALWKKNITWVQIQHYGNKKVETREEKCDIL